ncbi:hypothetical protein BZA05DRAFT_446363 [Tricharina praecox]|uniref:uncharacterized protein n=1 Tax=Tricharina praecox TaxID=43433 RepID=UPI00221E9C60|nr:uncharacterized protein BZA05DRAFT_446363 [Tricharina praecox]KAI5848834.1 hypothetical protein BZA05DRAFT_446363 [Tricharina praecox]
MAAATPTTTITPAASTPAATTTGNSAILEAVSSFLDILAFLAELTASFDDGDDNVIIVGDKPEDNSVHANEEAMEAEDAQSLNEVSLGLKSHTLIAAAAWGGIKEMGLY